MSHFQHQKTLPYPPEKVFKVFKRQMFKTFPSANRSNPLGAKSERDSKGIQGYTFHLEQEITDYQENRIYEVTTHASNHQVFVSRYELKNGEGDNTLLVLEEWITTPGFFGNINTLLTQLLFKGRAQKKAYTLFQSIESEINQKK